MSMDRITEIIAHFIGDFALSDELGRIRADYREIPAVPDADLELDGLVFKGLRLAPAHEIEDLDPEIVHLPLPPSPFAIFVAPPLPLPGPEHVLETVSAAVPKIELPPLIDASYRPDLVTGQEMPPPSSVAAILHMSNRIEDADFFGPVSAASIAAAAGLSDMLQLMSAQLAALSPLPAPLEALSGSSVGALDWASVTAEILAAAEQLVQSPLGGVVLLGGETLGVHVDGVLTDALPDWQDLLPQFLRDDDADDEAGDGSNAEAMARADGTDEPDDAEASGKADDPEAPNDTGGINGKSVAATDVEGAFDRAMTGLKETGTPAADAQTTPLIVTGANQLINEVTITSNWLDAPVIVVEGDARDLTAISQVNVTFDRDSIAGTSQQDQAPSLVKNAVSITSTSNVAPRDPDHAVQQPVGWAIARITGDLVQVNGVQQYNFASDTDSMRIDVPSSGLRLSGGENQLENLAVLNEFGWTFDLIVVGGNMLEANLIRQMNLALDDDIVAPKVRQAATPQPVPVKTSTGAKDLAPSKTVSHGKSDTSAKSQTSDTGPTTGVAEAVAVQSGTAAPVASAPVTSAPAAASSVAPKTIAPEPAADPVSSAAPATTPVAISTPASVSTQPAVSTPAPAASGAPANLSYNEARIHTQGQDVAAAVPKVLGQASKALTDGAEALGREVLGLDLFEGVELLKVLLIEGDFTTINWIDQINVLGDQDRVEMLQEAIAALPDAQLVTGSNLLVNLASISKLGVDSKIMAKGDAYSDALLHQAGFVEDAAPASGAGLAQLASEAVAFLADGMIETAAADLEAAQTTLDGGLAAMSTSQVDLMQTMLS